MRLRILHLEDSDLDHELVCRALRKSDADFQIERVDTLDTFSAALDRSDFHVVLADFRLNGFTALDAWQRMQERSKRVPVLLLSGAIGEAAAVSAIKVGISDYLPKDELDKLWRVLNRAIEMHHILLEKELADQELAVSEQRLSKFAEHLQSTIEQERASIAREIHDDIGGSLAAIRFDLAWVTRHNQDPATLSHIASASELLSQAISASQRIMVNLRPAVLDQGLVAAIHWLAAGFTKRTSIAITVDAPSHLDQLNKDKQLVAYRTTQEALTNISKYAKAQRVKIDLSDAEDVLTVEIADDGLGLSPEALLKPTSYGIRGLKERARTVGGWLDVSSRPGHGTALILSIPLGEKNAETAEEQR